jgi:VanZ family protein
MDSTGDRWTGGWTLKKWLWRWGPAVVVMAIIFVASNTPSRELPTLGVWDFFFKKGSHMLGYGLLAAAYVHGLSGSYRLSWRLLFAACGLAFLYAMTDEFHQLFTPGRTASFSDVLIDTCGAMLGAVAARFFNGMAWRREIQD